VLSPAVTAQTIKLGSLAPEGSPWDKALRRIAADWNAVSDGRLRVRVFAGGIAGDELSMLRKMRIDQLQAAAITGLGLGSIAQDLFAVQLPFLIRTDEEMAYVMEALEPTFNRMLEEKGFTLVAWFLAGWAHLFSKTPVTTPEEARRLKLHGDPVSPEIIEAWQELGFRVVAVPPTEVLAALQSDMLEAFLLTPLTAAAMQWFGLAKHMMDMPLAPMLSGIVVSERLWKRLSPDLREELLSVVDHHLDELSRETAALEEQALEIMLANGLQIHPIPARTRAAWQRVMEDGMDMITGTVVSERILGEVWTLTEEYRER
jgi:TRAP-type C4-dicarboxylate transport system substrate-binding protein